MASNGSYANWDNDYLISGERLNPHTAAPEPDQREADTGLDAPGKIDQAYVMFGEDRAPGGAGILGKTWAGGVHLLVGGSLDTVGSIAAGYLGTGATAGIYAMQQIQGKANLEKAIGDAGDFVNAFSGVWHDWVTQPANDLLLPDHLEQETGAIDTVEGWLQGWQDLVARGAHAAMTPEYMYLKSKGYDTMELEGAVDGVARGYAMASLFLLGIRKRGSGGKAAEVTPEEMNQVVRDSVDTVTDPFRESTGPQETAATGPELPSYDAFIEGRMATKRQVQERPNFPIQEELPLGKPQPLKNEPVSPQYELPFKEGDPRATGKYHPAREPAFKDPFIPEDAPIQPVAPDQGYRSMGGREWEPDVQMFAPEARAGVQLTKIPGKRKTIAALHPKAIPAMHTFDPHYLNSLTVQDLRAILQAVKGASPLDLGLRPNHKEGLVAAVGSHLRAIRAKRLQKFIESPEWKEYVAYMDEVNYRIAKAERGVEGSMPGTRATTHAEVATEVLTEMVEDSRGLTQAGVKNAAEVSAGLSRMRVAASLANESAFQSAMAKILKKDTVQMQLKQLPPEVMAKVAGWVEKPVDYGNRLGLLAKKTEVPPAPGKSPHVGKFSMSEMLTLFRELQSLEPALRLPGRKPVPKEKWNPKKHGDPARTQEGLISARGEFYLPAEARVLAQLIHTAKADFGKMSAEIRTTLKEQQAAVDRAHEVLVPEQRKQGLIDMGNTLKDQGIRTRHKGPNAPKKGELGHLNLAAFDVIDPVMKHLQAKGLGRGKRTKKLGRRDRTTTKGWEVWPFIREVFLGGKMIGELQRMAVESFEAGKPALLMLMSTVDQVPPGMRSTKMPVIDAWYIKHQQAFSDLITNFENPYSLASVLKQFEVKAVSGFRRYMDPTVTMMRVPKRLKEIAKKDLMSPGPETTAVGRALRNFFHYVYEYAKKHGIEVATKLDNWYPVIFKQWNQKQRIAFETLAASKGKTLWVTKEIIEASQESNGLVTAREARAKGHGNGRQLNLEKRRTYFKDFTNEELAPFVVDDPFRVAMIYGRETARRVSKAVRFGAKDEIWTQMRQQAIREAAEQGKELSSHHVNTIDTIRQVMDHTYYTAPPWLVRTMKWGIAWQSAVKLPLVALGSIGEIAVGVTNPTTQKHFVRAIAEAGTYGIASNVARSLWRDAPRWQGRKLAEIAARSVDVEMHDVLTATHAADFQSIGTNLVFQLNGLHSLTNMMQDVNARAFELALKDIVKKEFEVRLGRRSDNVKSIEGGLHAANKDWMTQYGIDFDAALRWYRDGAKIGEGAFWDNVAMPAMLRYLNDTVMTPRGVNMPRWMNNPWLAPIRHLMTYTSVYANTVLPNMLFGFKGAVLRDAPNNLWVKGARHAQTWGGIAAVVGLAALSEALLDLWKYGGEENHPLRDRIDDDKHWEIQQGIRTLNRTGVFGFGLSKMFDLYHSLLYGRYDANVMQGALISETSAMAELLLRGVAAGEVNSRTAAQWFIRNFPVGVAAAIPRNDDALLADIVGNREDMVDDLTDWIDDNIPLTGKRYKKKYRPY